MMPPLRVISDQLRNTLHYPPETILLDYKFADVFSSAPKNLVVDVAAFTRTPPSYRTAAFGVLTGNQKLHPKEALSQYRALGAPMFIVANDNDVSVWRVNARSAPDQLAQCKLSDVATLFQQYSNEWSPTSVHRAKSIGQPRSPLQLDFIDLGLLPVIESELHGKLDRLLADTLEEIENTLPSNGLADKRVVFRSVFRLIAAKILQDRGHPLSRNWDADRVDTVLAHIRRHYRLLPDLHRNGLSDQLFASGWDRIKSGISFANISGEALAFVYENTLVTPETRQIFGTHSTPRQAAEYIVDKLRFDQIDSGGNIRAYEPFTGAGVFLVAAMRQINDLLPSDLSEERRHDLLLRRIWGDEIDAFAGEVAKLSLILADYPNANGWTISETDLFVNETLLNRAKGADVVLCNPPFEDFDNTSRTRYPQAIARSHSKPLAALDAILDAKPKAIGFVLPPIFIDGKKSRRMRERVQRMYEDIELVQLPEHIFKESGSGSCLLIARVPRRSRGARTFLRSSVVPQRDRRLFLERGLITESRARERDVTNGDLWISDLEDLWMYLADSPRFQSVAVVHRGLEWSRGYQSKAISTAERPGYVRGLASPRDVQQFAHEKPEYLDVRRQSLRAGGVVNYPWDSPKLIVNAVRKSRNWWNLAATIDRNGLYVSQQLFGIWPKSSKLSLEAICAILNGPLANAFVKEHSSSTGARSLVSKVYQIPIPQFVPDVLTQKVREYEAAVTASDTQLFAHRSDNLARLLNEIDALVLRAYDLPPRLEHLLLQRFRGASRPVSHEWAHWFPQGFESYLPLYRFLSDEYRVATSGWVTKVFAPLPVAEAEAVREFLE